MFIHLDVLDNVSALDMPDIKIPDLDLGKYAKSLSQVKCPFDLSTAGLEEGVNAWCYTVETPQDYDNPDADQPSIKISILKVLADPQCESAKPVLYPSQGPGLSFKFFAQQPLSMFSGLYLEASRRLQRPFILIDSRSTGATTPSVLCQNPGANPLAISRECMQEWRDKHGFDMRNLNSLWVTMDMEVIKQAFAGDQTVHFMGHSYATVDGLEYIQAFPGSVESAVLSAIAHPYYGAKHISSWHGFQSALNAMFEDCERDDACKTAYPNLRDLYDTYIIKLEETEDAKTRNALASALLRLLDVSGAAGLDRACLLPLYLRAHALDDTPTITTIIAFLQRLRPPPSPDFANPTLYTARVCMDSARQYRSRCSDSDICSAPSWFNDMNRAHIYDFDLRASSGEAMGAFAEENAKFQLNKKAQSNVRTLVIGSTYDVTCPKVISEGVARDLEGATGMWTSGTGHFAVPMGGECEMKAIKAFFDDPEGYVQPECVFQIKAKFPTELPEAVKTIVG